MHITSTYIHARAIIIIFLCIDSARCTYDRYSMPCIYEHIGYLLLAIPVLMYVPMYIDDAQSTHLLAATPVSCSYTAWSVFCFTYIYTVTHYTWGQ